MTSSRSCKVSAAVQRSAVKGAPGEAAGEEAGAAAVGARVVRRDGHHVAAALDAEAEVVRRAAVDVVRHAGHWGTTRALSAHKFLRKQE